jgi:hypothetical protein
MGAKQSAAANADDTDLILPDKPTTRWVRVDTLEPDKQGSNGKLRLMTLESLDGRTLAGRRARELISEIEEELGDEPTVAQRQLARHAAILGAMIENIGVKWLQGETVALAEYALLINAQRRAFESL